MINRFKVWDEKLPPSKILAIRFQALGDVVITFPYLFDLQQKYPDCEIHFLTLSENKSIPLGLVFLKKIFSIGGCRNYILQYLFSILKLPLILSQKYDVVLDLQNHGLSNLLRRIIRPKAFVEFDKYSPLSAGERNRITIEKVGLGSISINLNLKTNVAQSVIHDLLKEAGWDGESKIVILNPAGFIKSRNWPLENYVRFVELWVSDLPNTQFLVIGTDRIAAQAQHMRSKLGKSVVPLINKTSQVEAFAIIRESSFMLTEDSGLMHMAWVQGVPTLALFGSSRSDWSSPQGMWSLCLHSGDLPCGACMLANCKFGDNRCLTRYTPEFVFEKSQQLISIQT